MTRSITIRFQYKSNCPSCELLHKTLYQWLRGLVDFNDRLKICQSTDRGVVCTQRSLGELFDEVSRELGTDGFSLLDKYMSEYRSRVRIVDEMIDTSLFKRRTDNVEPINRAVGNPNFAKYITPCINVELYEGGELKRKIVITGGTESIHNYVAYPGNTVKSTIALFLRILEVIDAWLSK